MAKTQNSFKELKSKEYKCEMNNDSTEVQSDKTSGYRPFF